MLSVCPISTFRACVKGGRAQSRRREGRAEALAPRQDGAVRLARRPPPRRRARMRRAMRAGRRGRRRRRHARQPARRLQEGSASGSGTAPRGLPRLRSATSSSMPTVTHSTGGRRSCFATAGSALVRRSRCAERRVRMRSSAACGEEAPRRLRSRLREGSRGGTACGAYAASSARRSNAWWTYAMSTPRSGRERGLVQRLQSTA